MRVAPVYTFLMPFFTFAGAIWISVNETDKCDREQRDDRPEAKWTFKSVHLLLVFQSLIVTFFRSWFRRRRRVVFLVQQNRTRRRCWRRRRLAKPSRSGFSGAFPCRCCRPYRRGPCLADLLTFRVLLKRDEIHSRAVHAVPIGDVAIGITNIGFSFAVGVADVVSMQAGVFGRLIRLIGVDRRAR
jgi:hypothetical protein